MKRTIKFRFWDKAINKMLHRHLEKYDVEHPDIIVMQFTGLLDKNGKEIYEDDILLLPLDFKGIVKYKEGSFIIENTNNKFYYLGELISHLSYKIIGNIHETPEIL